MFRKIIISTCLLLVVASQTVFADPFFKSVFTVDSPETVVTDTASTLSGEWEYTYNPDHADVPLTMFTLQIDVTGGTLKAQYCAIAHSGGKIDCSTDKELNVSGTLKNSKATVNFYSFFSSAKDIGKAEIAVIDSNRIQWRIIRSTKGAAYAPKVCILKRKVAQL